MNLAITEKRSGNTVARRRRLECPEQAYNVLHSPFSSLFIAMRISSFSSSSSSSSEEVKQK